MRLAVVSDIHGNLPALEAVLAEVRGEHVDRVVNLGDIVSGPLWPRETAALLRACPGPRSAATMSARCWRCLPTAWVRPTPSRGRGWPKKTCMRAPTTACSTAGALATRFPGDNDGKVSVARAAVEGMSDMLVLPETHTFIVLDAEVAAQTLHFLRHGRFRRPGAPAAQVP